MTLPMTTLDGFFRKFLEQSQAGDDDFFISRFNEKEQVGYDSLKLQYGNLYTDVFDDNYVTFREYLKIVGSPDSQLATADQERVEAVLERARHQDQGGPLLKTALGKQGIRYFVELARLIYKKASQGAPDDFARADAQTHFISITLPLLAPFVTKETFPKWLKVIQALGAEAPHGMEDMAQMLRKSPNPSPKRSWRDVLFSGDFTGASTAITFDQKVNHYLDHYLEQINQYGSHYLAMRSQNIAIRDLGILNYPTYVGRYPIKKVDKDTPEDTFSLGFDFRHYQVDEMTVTSFKERGLEVHVRAPWFFRLIGYKVVANIGDTVMGVYEIPKSGIVNDFELHFPQDEYKGIQIYLVPKKSAPSFEAERLRNGSLSVDGAVFISIGQFKDTELARNSVLYNLYDEGSYDPQYLVDAKNKFPKTFLNSPPWHQPQEISLVLRAIVEAQGMTVDIPESVTETEGSRYIRSILHQGIARQTARNQALGVTTPSRTALLKTFSEAIAGSQESASRLLTTEVIWNENDVRHFFYELTSEILFELQALEHLPELDEVVRKRESLYGLLASLSSTNSYFEANVSTKDLLFGLYQALYPELIEETSAAYVQTTFFEPTLAKANGSYDLVYHYNAPGQEEQTFIWKSVFPGTLFLRGFSGLPREDAIYPGAFGHGIMFTGVDANNIPMAVSHPNGYRPLNDQLSKMHPETVGVIKVTSDTQLMHKAAEAAIFLEQHVENFDMRNPRLPFDPNNRVTVPGNPPFPYYYKSMYCFMLLAKAYELARFDMSRINGFDLDYMELETLLHSTNVWELVSGQTGRRLKALIEVDENQGWTRDKALRVLQRIVTARDFPGFENQELLEQWLETQPYKDRQLLIELFYYSGQEMYYGEGVKVIRALAVHPET